MAEQGTVDLSARGRCFAHDIEGLQCKLWPGHEGLHLTRDSGGRVWGTSLDFGPVVVND